MRVCEGGASQARPSHAMTPQVTGSEASAAMEETCDWRTHTHSESVATEPGIRHSESIVLICHA